MIYWALVYKAIEYFSTIVMFELFLYEEICQGGLMMCYVMTQNYNSGSISNIINLTKIHGIEPGRKCLDDQGMFAPWCEEPFRMFYLATEQGLEAFDGG